MKTKKDLFLINSAHLFFGFGTLLLFYYAFISKLPIQFNLMQLLQVISSYLLGYVFVFMQWIKSSISNVSYLGNADNVPNFLTQILYGSHPYLFTFGRSNSSNDKFNQNLQKYNNKDIANKKFIDIFCIHAHKYALIIFCCLIFSLPFLIFKQAIPSYLQFAQYNFIAYALYTYLILVVWLSSFAIVLFRIYILIFHKI